MNELFLKLLNAVVQLNRAAERIEELERENAALKRTNARYMTKLDQFHTGYAVPRALGKQTPNEFVVQRRISYNELARLHANQRESIQSYQEQLRNGS